MKVAEDSSQTKAFRHMIATSGYAVGSGDGQREREREAERRVVTGASLVDSGMIEF